MKAYLGDIAFSPNFDKLITLQNGFVLVDELGRIVGTTSDRPTNCEIVDHSGCLIIPSFADLHVHACQFQNMGIGYDLPLLDWLCEYTLSEEKKFEDLEYASKVYSKFVEALFQNGSFHSVIMASLHEHSTRKLIDLLIERKLTAFVGKCNMDIPLTTPTRSNDLCECSVQESISATRRLIDYTKSQSALVQYAISPRFVPSCSDQLLASLGELAEEQNLSIHSHLCENRDEIEGVVARFPSIQCGYTGVYDRFGLLTDRTVMAHCVHMNENELDLLAKRNCFVAHCPTSNINLKSGVCPVKKYVRKGIRVGLGSDVAGGNSLNMFEVMRSAIDCSKFLDLESNEDHQLSVNNAFHLATKSGGSFFAKTGSFEPTYQFNALVIDDKNIKSDGDEISERIERLIYRGNGNMIVERYLRAANT